LTTGAHLTWNYPKFYFFKVTITENLRLSLYMKAIGLTLSLPLDIRISRKKFYTLFLVAILGRFLVL